MTAAVLTIQLSQTADASAVQSQIEAALAQTESVEDAIVAEDTDRSDIATVASVIVASVVLVQQATTLVESVTKLVRSVRVLLEESQSLTSVLIEVAGIKIDPAESDEAIEAKLSKVAEE